MSGKHASPRRPPLVMPLGAAFFYAAFGNKAGLCACILERYARTDAYP
ncbi:hypothetical protein JOE11_003932 [Robbsia andropogonis]